MALSSGTRIGLYEILSALGSGGMGEVYRARDTQLQRDVAIKVLPAALAHDTERLARFEREARTLASLNHPNIAQIHGLEESAGTKALVMELVDGPTLADRIGKGGLPLDEALPIAKQIAEALEAAHEQGIIHRDLKPANIKVRDDGTVKVLDFGLAKLTAPGGSPGIEATVTQSPTITSPAMTMAGVILGTAAYMSPEQAKGRAADKRSDVWAFGCVLFEALAGSRAFEGEDVSDTLASVLKGEPRWTALPANLPPSVRTLLRSCLTKDRRHRLADIAGALFILQHQDQLALPPAVPPAAARPRSHGTILRLAIVVTVALITAGWLGWAFRPDDPRASLVTRFGVQLPIGSLSTNALRQTVAVAPDGTRFVFVADDRLYVHSLNSLHALSLDGSRGSGDASPRGVFFSPDSQWIGYWAAGELRKISVDGGAATMICVAENPTGAHWSPNGTIVFAQTTGVWRVSADGGAPAQIMRIDSGSRIQAPQLLPGEQTLLATVAAGRDSWDDAAIMIQPLDGGAPRRVHIGGNARYVSTGHLLYMVRGVMLAVRFDAASLTVTGGPVPMVEDIAVPPTLANGPAQFSVSESGTLVYATRPDTAMLARTLVWVDRQGHEEAINAPSRAYVYPRLSPDGSQVALDALGDNRDIYIWDLARGADARLTTHPGLDRSPTWTADGRRIIFSSDRDGVPSLYWQSADGVGAAELLLDATRAQFPHSVSRDGRWLVLRENVDVGAADLLRVTIDRRPLQAQPLIRTSFSEFNAEISPDGRWLAYQSNMSGRFEVYVRPFPEADAGGQWTISTNGGREPVWSRQGTDLFYRTPSGAVMGAAVRSKATTWDASRPVQVLEGSGYLLGTDGVNPYRTYDTLDGHKFLMLKNREVTARDRVSPAIVVVQNWAEELKEKVPKD